MKGKKRHAVRVFESSELLYNNKWFTCLPAYHPAHWQSEGQNLPRPMQHHKHQQYQSGLETQPNAEGQGHATTWQQLMHHECHFQPGMGADCWWDLPPPRLRNHQNQWLHAFSGNIPTLFWWKCTSAYLYHITAVSTFFCSIFLVQPYLLSVNLVIWLKIV